MEGNNLLGNGVWIGVFSGEGPCVELDSWLCRGVGLGGMASTAFWVDPLGDKAVVFMTQLVPSGTYNIRRELRTLVYSAIED